MSAATSVTERRLVEAACRGDEDAFRRLVEPHRRGLRAHCYRTLGSLDDTDDALQDALLHAWRGLGGFESRSSLRNWLYRIATNASLDALARRSKRVLPIDYRPPADAHSPEGGGPVAEPVWGEPCAYEPRDVDDRHAGPAARYEQREAVGLAFVATLQHLPARQRTVLVLREVLGFSAIEVSQALGTTVASVNSALQRARKAVDERVPEKSEHVAMRSLDDERVREIVQNFVDAFERGDVNAIVSLLAEDPLAMRPYVESRPRRDRRVVARARRGAVAPRRPARARVARRGERRCGELKGHAAERRG